MNKKEFKTLDEQLNIFKTKGLIINDEEKAKEILLMENYFFINGYRYLFMKSNKDKKFINNATFDELYTMFLFDRNLRNILFKNLLVIENNIKSIISYQLSKKYGYKEENYLKLSNFNTDIKEQRRVNDVVNKMKRQIRVNGEKHTATYHYINNYGYVPLWILVKVLSFGLINELYGILKPEDKYEIANYYKLDIESMEIYLALLSNYRNLCAHEDIVFDHKTERSIPDTEYHKKLNIFRMDDEYIYGKNDIFAVIIMFKFLLEDDEFRLMLKEFNYEFQELDARIDSIPVEKILDVMGIPKNFMDILDM